MAEIKQHSSLTEQAVPVPHWRPDFQTQQRSTCHSPAGKHSSPTAQAAESATVTSLGVPGSTWGSVGNSCCKEAVWEGGRLGVACARTGRVQIEESAFLVIKQIRAEPCLISSLSSTQRENTGSGHRLCCPLGFVMKSWGRLGSKQQLNTACLHEKFPAPPFASLRTWPVETQPHLFCSVDLYVPISQILRTVAV